jgi:hypothetical protein
MKKLYKLALAMLTATTVSSAALAETSPGYFEGDGSSRYMLIPNSTDFDITEAVPTPIFITLGQSNADGSAFFDTDEDARLKEWYEKDHGNLKMYYRSCYVVNQSTNSLGDQDRWVFDHTVDVQPGWLDLWYRNENTDGRTAMNMIHGYGTSSTGTDTNCAQGRRGMEGQFGVTFHEKLPEKDLYMLKLGASGSFIASWAYPGLDNNWTYFMQKIYKPAIEEMLAQGKRPMLAGIWWMQGCADRNKEESYYETYLSKFVDNCRSQLGYDDAYIYIGHVVKPGENSTYPGASVQYGENVRTAQEAVAAKYERVVTVDTKDCDFQYESSFSGYLHYSHKGVNKIGEMLATDVASRGESSWTLFTTPGDWTETADGAVFTPSIGNPTITYSQENDVITATLAYPGWSETKTFQVTPKSYYTVTIDAPKEIEGTLTVYNGSDEVTSGSSVAEGTVLTISAVSSSYYDLNNITVNGQALNGTSYTVDGNCTIAANFDFVPYNHSSATTVRDSSNDKSGRYITTLKVSDGTNTATLSGPGSGASRAVYSDQTSVSLDTTAGSTLSFTVTGSGTWMQTYFYVDLNNDQMFVPEVGSNGVVTADSELLSYNGYRPDGNTWYNSIGTALSSGALSVTSPNLPTVTIPASLATGSYRARYKLDWDSIDPYGNRSALNLIHNNYGVIIDFMLDVTNTSGVDDITSAAANLPVEYYNLNGMRVNRESLARGVYIARQGAIAQKLVIK